MVVVYMGESYFRSFNRSMLRFEYLALVCCYVLYSYVCMYICV